MKRDDKIKGAESSYSNGAKMSIHLVMALKGHFEPIKALCSTDDKSATMSAHEEANPSF